MFFDENFLSIFQQGKGDPTAISQYLEKHNCKLDPEEEGRIIRQSSRTYF